MAPVHGLEIAESSVEVKLRFWYRPDGMLSSLSCDECPISCRQLPALFESSGQPAAGCRCQFLMPEICLRGLHPCTEQILHCTRSCHHSCRQFLVPKICLRGFHPSTEEIFQCTTVMPPLMPSGARDLIARVPSIHRRNLALHTAVPPLMPPVPGARDLPAKLPSIHRRKPCSAHGCATTHAIWCQRSA